jgi:hypothetical protein
VDVSGRRHMRLKGGICRREFDLGGDVRRRRTRRLVIVVVVVIVVRPCGTRAGQFLDRLIVPYVVLPLWPQMRNRNR